MNNKKMLAIGIGSFIGGCGLSYVVLNKLTKLALEEGVIVYVGRKKDRKGEK